jgi:YbbR domain-containing protein
VRSLLDFVVRNWPLKLAAIGLATVLYAGVVMSGDDRVWPGSVPIQIVQPPAGGVLLDPPGSVEQIRYRAPLEAAARLTSDSFRATIDLGGLTPAAGAPTQEAIVRVVPLVAGVQVVDFEPRSLPVRLDSIVSRSIPVTVQTGEAPAGFVLGPPQLDPSTVTVRGASTRLAEVAQARVRVPVDGSGLNIDQSLDVEVVDGSGNLVPGVEVMPDRVGVRIDVARQLTYASLPVVADVTGAAAPGYRVSGVTTDPVTVTVSGEVDALGQLVSVATQPIDITDASADRVVDTSLVLPPDVTLIGDPAVRVTIAVVADEGTRTQEVGVTPIGARRDRIVTLSAPSVQVTLGGTITALDALAPGETTATVDLTGLAVGRHEVPVAVSAPPDLAVLAVAPETLVVRIAAAPPATPAPTGPAASPSAAAEALGPSVAPSAGAAAAVTGGAPPPGGA